MGDRNHELRKGFMRKEDLKGMGKERVIEYRKQKRIRGRSGSQEHKDQQEKAHENFIMKFISLYVNFKD